MARLGSLFEKHLGRPMKPSEMIEERENGMYQEYYLLKRWRVEEDL